jgi:hypothetical protein
MIAACRSNLALRQPSWRGGVAFGIFVISVVLLWQSVPLAFAL